MSNNGLTSNPGGSMGRFVTPKLSPFQPINPQPYQPYNNYNSIPVRMSGNPTVIQKRQQQVLTPQTAQLPSPPAENLEVVFLVPASIQLKQEEEHEEEDETDETSLDQDELDTFHCYKELGEKLGSLLSSLKNQNKKLNAEKEVVTAQLEEAKESIAFLNSKNEEVVKQAEEDVSEAKSQELIWMKEYQQLHEKVTALEKESEEKDKAIKEQEVKVLKFEASEKKLSEQLEEKKNKIKSVEDTYKKKCQEIDDVSTEVKKLQDTVNQCKESFQELQAKVTVTSRELEKEKNEKQAIWHQLQKKTNKNNDLKNEVKDLRKKDAVLKMFDAELSQFRGGSGSALHITERKRSLSRSSSSLERELFPEVSFVAMDEDKENGANSTGNEAEQLETQDVPKPNTRGRPWKIPKISSTEKRHRGNRNATSVFSNKKSNTGGHVEIPEVSSSSRPSNSPSSSSTRLRSRSGTKK